VTGDPEVISSPVGLVPTNAPAVSDQSLETRTYRELVPCTINCASVAVSPPVLEGST